MDGSISIDLTKECNYVGDAGGCPLCQNGAEDIKHMIFTCDRAKSLAFVGYLGEDTSPKMTDRSISVILEEIFTRDDQVHTLEMGLVELVITAA